MLKNQHTVQTDSEQELPLNEVIAAIKIPTFNLMHLKLPKSAFELCTDVLMDNLFKTKRITLSPPSADKTILGIENNDAWLLSYELTLMIFLYLDPKSITQCMLVCRHFLEIANDSAIRQLLWCTKDAIERRVMLKSLTASDRFSSGFERLISSHLQMADPSIKDTDEILRPYRAEQPGSHGFVMRN